MLLLASYAYAACFTSPSEGPLYRYCGPHITAVCGRSIHSSMRTLRYAAVTILLLSEGPLLRTTDAYGYCGPHKKKASAYRYCGPHITTYNSSMRTLRSIAAECTAVCRHTAAVCRRKIRSSMQKYSSSMHTLDTQQSYAFLPRSSMRTLDRSSSMRTREAPQQSYALPPRARRATIVVVTHKKNAASRLCQLCDVTHVTQRA